MRNFAGIYFLQLYIFIKKAPHKTICKFFNFCDYIYAYEKSVGYAISTADRC